jgi:hypothetical protein
MVKSTMHKLIMATIFLVNSTMAKLKMVTLTMSK